MSRLVVCFLGFLWALANRQCISVGPLFAPIDVLLILAARIYPARFFYYFMNSQSVYLTRPIRDYQERQIDEIEQWGISFRPPACEWWRFAAPILQRDGGTNTVAKGTCPINYIDSQGWREDNVKTSTSPTMGPCHRLLLSYPGNEVVAFANTAFSTGTRSWRNMLQAHAGGRVPARGFWRLRPL